MTVAVVPLPEMVETAIDDGTVVENLNVNEVRESTEETHPGYSARKVKVVANAAEPGAGAIGPVAVNPVTLTDVAPDAIDA